MKHPLQTAVFLFTFPGTLLATPTVNIDTKYYSIYGLTANELRKEMRTKSAIKQAGNTYDANTSWYVNWHYIWNTSNGQCHITNITTSVDVIFTLPKWIDRNDSDPMLKGQWDRFYEALTAHENGHKDFGVYAALEIERRVLILPSSNTCSALEKKANSLTKSILDKYVALEKKYDKKNNHGMNDGAIFPYGQTIK